METFALAGRGGRLMRAMLGKASLMLLAMGLASIGIWGFAEAQEPKTLVIAMGADQTGLDPQTVLNDNSGYVISTIFDNLVEMKSGSSLLTPGLAESWIISQDGKVYTFKLRHNVEFHDGTPMNAHAVAEDLDRAINPQNPCYVPARGVPSRDPVFFGSPEKGTAVKIEATDDYTLRFTLPEPNAPFLSNLAQAWAGITSPVATKKYNCDTSQHPVGTGPFKFVEAARNDHVTLEANPSYWGGRPKVDRLIFEIVPESGTRLLKLERNEVQILAEVPPSDYARVRGNPALKLYKEPGNTLLGASMANDWGPFKDKRVRQAMNYAVDKEAINKALYDGAMTASQGMPPILWGYDKSIKPYPYDPAKAAQLLKEAGYQGGFTTEMMMYANPRAYNPAGGAKLGQAIQGYLVKVGVRVQATQYEWGAYLSRLRKEEWVGIAICGNSGDSGDPDTFLGNYFEMGSNNDCGRYNDAEFNRLVREGRRVSDQAKRAQIYREANRILHDDAPWIFVNHVDQVKAARANIKGFVLNTVPYFFHMELVSLQ